MPLQILAAAAVAALAMFQIVRNGVAQDEQPERLGSFLWRHHPDVLRAVAMRQVGEAARTGQVPSRLTMEAFQALAESAPRAPEPFLVNAALALKGGNRAQAHRLLMHALRRDPRSTAGRFLLADLYLSSGRFVEGLRELALLTRIMPSSSVTLAGALQNFARSGGTATQLRELFAINPALEIPILSTLANDPANADLIVAAASDRDATGDSSPPAWQEKLLNVLVDRHEYRKAYELWRQEVGIPKDAAYTVYNPRYVTSAASPPFNWALTSSEAGFAESQNGTLHVVHYGAANATLAKQMLLLAPGSYALATTFRGTSPATGQLSWSITCLPARKQVFVAAVRGESGSMRGGFIIPPASCPAQQLELIGNVQEPVSIADVSFGQLQLEQVLR